MLPLAIAAKNPLVGRHEVQAAICEIRIMRNDDISFCLAMLSDHDVGKIDRAGPRFVEVRTQIASWLQRMLVFAIVKNVQAGIADSLHVVLEFRKLATGLELALRRIVIIENIVLNAAGAIEKLAEDIVIDYDGIPLLLCRSVEITVSCHVRVRPRVKTIDRDPHVCVEDNLAV